MGGSSSSGQQNVNQPYNTYEALLGQGFFNIQPSSASTANQIATQGDIGSYAASDLAYQQKYPQLSAGLTTYANNAAAGINTPATGLSLTPGEQSQFMQSGLTSSLQNLGANNLGNLQAGSAGTDIVGKNLGLNLLNFQQQNIGAQQQQQQFANQNFANAVNMNPERQLGLSGADQSQIYLNNIANQNALNVGLGESIMGSSSNIASANATNAANASNSKNGAMMGLAGTAATTAATVAAVACWVAREVYGTRSFKWMIFRYWMLNESPSLFRRAYLTYGERFALWIHGHKTLKSIIKIWMSARIKSTLGHAY